MGADGIPREKEDNNKGEGKLAALSSAASFSRTARLLRKRELHEAEILRYPPRRVLSPCWNLETLPRGEKGIYRTCI